jgi:hypothetical protein
MNEQEDMQVFVEKQTALRGELPPLEKAAFASEFIDMASMKAYHAIEERLKGDKDAMKLLDAMYCLLLYQRYQENP